MYYWVRLRPGGSTANGSAYDALLARICTTQIYVVIIPDSTSSTRFPANKGRKLVLPPPLKICQAVCGSRTGDSRITRWPKASSLFTKRLVVRRMWR